MTGQIYYRGQCDYAELDGVNISLLKIIGKSPAHYLHALEHGRAETLALELGTATHIAILEPERFLKEFALWDDKLESGKTRPRRGKQWDAFVATNAGKKIIREDEYDLATAMRDAVRADRLAMRYLAHGRHEVAMTWDDAETGIGCKGRVDWLTEIDGEPVLVDVKTARDPGALFSVHAAKLGYHIQLAFYSDGYERITGRMPRFAVAAVENKPPHDVVVYRVPPEVIDVGRDEYRKLLARLRECLDRDEWPGYAGMSEQTLHLPAWAVPGEDEIEIRWNE